MIQKLYLCRVLPFKDYFHKPNTCPILKQLLPNYTTQSLVSSLPTITRHDIQPLGITRKTKPKQTYTKRKKKIPTPSAIPIKMCYDTGTVPKSLCSKKEFFRDLILFDKPKLVTLADSAITSQVLAGQGTLDIIINNKYRIWIFAYFTAASDALLSAVDHLSYSKCRISGENGKIAIHCPTFQFDVSGSDNLEFKILPGKSSNKPVLWQPFTTEQIEQVTNSDMVKIQRYHNDSTLPQRVTNQASGYDITSSIATTISPNSIVTAPLGFAMSFPSHLQCSLKPRSSLSLQDLNVALGTIDSDYRGEVKAIIANTSSTPVDISISQRIGQLVLAPIAFLNIHEVNHLNQTPRGSNGFGSTGHNKLLHSKRARFPLFLPTLSSICEYLQARSHTDTTSSTKPTTSSPAHVNQILTTDMNKLVNQYTETDMEDVPIETTQKIVHGDAIHLFPKDMYKSGHLNITGTELDATASPEQTKNINHTTDAGPPSPAPANETNEDITIKFKPLSQITNPTTIVDEHNIYAYIDNYDTSIIATESTDDYLTLLNDDIPPLTSILDRSLTRPTPRIPPSDRVRSTEPTNKIVTTEYMQKCFGFRNINPILKTLKDQSLENITVRDTGNHPILSRGEAATLPKAKSNSKPVKKTPEYGQIWHYDIVYSNGCAQLEESNMPSFSWIEKAAKGNVRSQRPQKINHQQSYEEIYMTNRVLPR